MFMAIILKRGDRKIFIRIIKKINETNKML